MRLKSVETTPNPNSMKLNFHESLGKAITYTSEDAQDSPVFVRDLLNIDGVKSVFVCQDFITINRVPGAVWDKILAAAKQIRGGETTGTVDEIAGNADEAAGNADEAADAGETAATLRQKERFNAEKSGQVSVVVQTFKGIPLQVKVLADGVEKRVALPERFSAAALRVQDETRADFLKERYWADWGVRYGDADEIAAQVADEIEGTVDEKSLQSLCDVATGKVVEAAKPASQAESEANLASSDWHVRLRAVQELGLGEDDIPLLERALRDEQMQVRRFAAAGLGATGSNKAVASLCRALLNDVAVAVRRTAGDALSDIGDVSAQEDVCKSLSDENKLVRWRACRFLAEVGTKDALPSLKSVLDDKEFEVRLEAEAAVERIMKGDKGLAPVWKRMHEDNTNS